MHYYLISDEQGLLERFSKRIPALRNAVLIKDEEQLFKELQEVPGNTFFLIHLKALDEKTSDWVMEIKERAPHAKLLYVTSEISASDLKGHQLTPIGGDAYIHEDIAEEDFVEMLDALKAPEFAVGASRLELNSDEADFINLDLLPALKNHPVSQAIDELFKTVITTASSKPKWQSLESLTATDSEQEEGEPVGIKDQELSLDEGEELDLGLIDESRPATELSDDGMELSLDGDEGLELGEFEIKEDLSEESEEEEELSLGDEGEEEELSLSEDDEDFFSLEEGEPETMENLGELSFDEAPDLAPDDALSMDLAEPEDSLELSPDDADSFSLGEESLEESLGFAVGESEDSLELGDDDSNFEEQGVSLDLSDNQESFGVSEESLSFDNAPGELDLSAGEMDLSDDAKEKLKEIDAILDYDASQVQIRNDLMKQENLDEPLVSEDLELGDLGFGGDEELNLDSTGEIEAVVEEPLAKEEKPKRKKKEAEKYTDLGTDLKEISQNYSSEMERMQATISNLRADREELLAKIQKMEEEKLLHGRQNLSLRAELDEKKIELTIIRKKLNEEINELKDRVKLVDERRLILEEKNRILAQELDKAGQKNKIDIKKVQMRERELEQKLELLKSDAETQIRNRDLKILELKRKIDAMEFDMESISLQEKRSVESRYELEDKLDKAIKTLRSAITVLEEESDRSSALDALKKNIDM